MCADTVLRARVRIQRGGLIQALKFLKRVRSRSDHVSLSYDGRSILIDCNRCKAEIEAVGNWNLLVTLPRVNFMELMRLTKLLPETVEMTVNDSCLQVHTWSFETESIIDMKAPR